MQDWIQVREHWRETLRELILRTLKALSCLQTKGEGVHMCLNSLADDKLTASVRCLAPNGHLLEIGKYDILKGTALSMRPMHDNITFHGINLDSLFKGAQKEAVGLFLAFFLPQP